MENEQIFINSFKSAFKLQLQKYTFIHYFKGGFNESKANKKLNRGTTMVYDESRTGQENTNPDDQENVNEQPVAVDHEVLDTDGSVQPASRRGRGRAKDEWPGERLVFCENGNQLELVLTRNENRYYRVDFILNGHNIKPVTLPGRSPATSYWDMLKTHIKEVDQHARELENNE